MSIVLVGSTSGSITLQEPAVAGSTTLDLPATSGTVVVGSSAVSAAGQIPFSTNGTTYTPTAKIVSDTAKSATSTSVDFTGIPSWVKRVTIMFNGVSGSGTSNFLVQIGSGSVTATGYSSMSARAGVAFTGVATSSTAGFIAIINANTNTLSGQMIISLQNNNTWTQSSGFYLSGTDNVVWGGGISPALGGALDRVRITTVNGTDTFDAGTINILYE
jgi:hypothetical protein